MMPPLTRGTVFGRAGNAEMTKCEAQLSSANFMKGRLRKL